MWKLGGFLSLALITSTLHFTQAQNRFELKGADSAYVEVFVRVSRANAFLSYKDPYLDRLASTLRNQLYVLDSSNYFINYYCTGYYKRKCRLTADSSYCDTAVRYEKKHKAYWEASQEKEKWKSILDGLVFPRKYKATSGLDTTKLDLFITLDEAAMFNEYKDDSLFKRAAYFGQELYRTDSNSAFISNRLGVLYYNKGESLTKRVTLVSDALKIQEKAEFYFLKSVYYLKRQKYLDAKKTQNKKTHQGGGGKKYSKK